MTIAFLLRNKKEKTPKNSPSFSISFFSLMRALEK